MNAVLRFALVAVLILGSILPAAGRKRSSHSPPRKADVEAATRLQVFLERANFSPGKIDGRYNDLKQRALALYRESRGRTTPNSATATQTRWDKEMLKHGKRSGNFPSSDLAREIPSA